MANRPNVGQHVVPQCYLKHFADAGGKIHVQDKDTGRIFASGTDGLCKEKEIYTLLVGGKRDFSFESINNDIESALGPVLTELHDGVDLEAAGVRTKIFTHLAAFTANLIARSRVLRRFLDGSLARINKFLEDNPTLIDDLPEDKYQEFLKNPAAFPKILNKFPGGMKYLDVLRDASKHNQPPSGVDDTVACLNTLKGFHHQVLLKARTGAAADLIVEVGAKADLLITDTPRFISADDPVVFLRSGARETQVVPTNVAIWTESGRGVYLPLNPKTALLWSTEGTYSAKRTTGDDVRRYNALMKENAIRHTLASDPADFT